jgi:fructokinase
MEQGQLFPMIRSELARLLNGYVRAIELTDNLDQYVVPPQLANRAGICGALVLAEQAYQTQQNRSTSGRI